MGLKLQPFHLKRSIKSCFHCQVSSQALSLHSLRYDVYQLCAVQQAEVYGKIKYVQSKVQT